MKKYTILIFFILTLFKIVAQDSIVKNRCRINEFNLFISKPIIFSTQENGVQLVRSSIKDESLIDNEINNGFSDTMKGNFYRGTRHYFPELFGLLFSDRLKYKPNIDISFVKIVFL